jgi:nucleoside-diphosphate-sugar epimerase/predicted dehydrogenase
MTQALSLASPEAPPRVGSARGWRVGLLGAGYIAEWHAKASRLVDGVSLAAVCDRIPARAEATAQAFGIPCVFSSLEEMLRSVELDAVHVLLPPDRHFEAGMAVLDAGVSLFLEKPMCTRAEDCRALVERAERGGLKLGVGHNFLFSEAYRRLRDDVRAGALGPLDQVEVVWSRELGQATHGPFDIWMLREPQNVMLEVGPHSVAHVLDLVGEPDPGSLRVRAGNPLAMPTGTRFHRRWLVDGQVGRTGIEMRFSFAPGFAEHAVRVRGLLGSATADILRNTYLLHRHTPRHVDFDAWAMLRREGRSLSRQGTVNLARYALSKLHLSRRGSAYGASIAGALEAFYRGSAEAPDPRISGRSGERVIATCEEIGRRAGLPAAPRLEVVAPAAAPSAPARVLVLGATGFIGQELVRQLVGAGHGVRVLVRSASKLPPDLRVPGVEVVPGDLADRADVDRALRGIECVYHLARANVKSWADYQRHDVEVTRLLAERALAAGVKRFVYTGTIDSYYAGARAGRITERTPLDPAIERRNNYARAKAAGEALLWRMQREQKLPLVVFRPGIVIGRGGSPFHWGVAMWQNDTVCRLWGEGRNPLPIVLVQDVARGLVLGLEAPGIEGESFNLIGEPVLTAREYLDELDRVGGMRLQRVPTPIWSHYLADLGKWVVKVLVRHPDRRRPAYRDWESRTQKALFDCTRTRERLGWQPVASREEIVRLGIEEPWKEFAR